MAELIEIEKVDYTTKGFVSHKAYLNADKILYMEPCDIRSSCGSHELMRVRLSDSSAINVSKECGELLLKRLM